MTQEEARNRILQLRKIIEEYNQKYYKDAKPVVSDWVYDAYDKELKQLETAFPELASPESPTNKVGEDHHEGFITRPHKLPMLSLDNTYSPDDIRKFVAYVRKGLGENAAPVFTVEPKIDGVSISLRYENGLLVQALTRGNGREGDDVTANVRTIQSIPHTLAGGAPFPAVFEARGELYMSRKDFSMLNAHRLAAGEDEFANARNATAGTIKLLDPSEVAQRPLDALFYAQGEIDGLAVNSQQELFAAFKRFGLRTQSYTGIATDLDSVMADIMKIHENRDSFPYDIDGAVIKIDSFAQRATLGMTAKAPSWAKAYKYTPEQISTLLRAITVQVGRTGILTPVAELQPVRLAGSTISRATLHNEDEIKRKDIRVGDTVTIEKAGDVIPAVVSVVLSKRPPNAVPFDLPAAINKKCPVCGSPIERKKGFVAWRCTNLFCPAQTTRRLEYFVARNALDIESIGPIVAEALVAQHIVNDPLDLFTLKADAIEKINLGTENEPRKFRKDGTNIYDAIQRARQKSLSAWIHAIGIPDVGAATAIVLGNLHNNIDELADSRLLRALIILMEPNSKCEIRTDDLPDSTAQLADLLMPTGLIRRTKSNNTAKKLYTTTSVGIKTARSILNFFKDGIGKNILERLHTLGISPKGGRTITRSQPLAGQIFVLTGKLNSMTRDEASALIRDAGGTVTSAVSSNTSYLVSGEDSEGTTKTVRAAALGIKVISENDLINMLQE